MNNQWTTFQGPIEILVGSGPQVSQNVGDDLPHVLLVLDQFPRMLGGGEKIALRMAKLFPQYGYRVSILTFAVHPESQILRDPPPCPLYLLPLARTYDLQALRGALALGRFVKEQRVQLVQTFFESSDLWAGLVVKLFSKAKLVWSRRDMGILRARKHQIAYRWMARLPDRVFAVSEQVRRHAIEVDGIPADRVETIYNGLDLGDGAARERGFELSSHRSVLTVGNIRHVKGLDVLVEAAALVLKEMPDVCFTVAGGVIEPDYFKRVMEIIEALSLTDRFHFAGSIADLRPYLKATDLFVLPSRSEGFSNAILEAMAHGLPVVATRVGGNDEAVEDGVSGHIVPAEDAPALADAILLALKDASGLKAMGEQGRLRVAQHFSTDAMMTRTTATYDCILTG